MTICKQCACVFLSALLIAASIPNEFLPYGSALYAFIALVPFYYALSYAQRTVTARIYTCILFMITHIISSFWLAKFEGFAVFTLGASAGANAVYGWLIGPVFFYALKSQDRTRPWLFASLYVLWEWVKSTGFLGYPWGTLPMSVMTLPELMQIADITGTYGITFVLALSSAVIAECLMAYYAPSCIPAQTGHITAVQCRSAAKTAPFVQSEAAHNALFTLALLVISLTYGCIRLHENVKPYTTVQLALIQHNADSWNSSSSDAIRSAQNMTRECIAHSPEYPDLIVWSESVLTRSYPDYQHYYSKTPHNDAFIPFVQETGIPFLIGGPILISSEPFRASNSAILLDEYADMVDFYGKTQLVPFAENIPFIEYEWMQRFMMKIAGFNASWTPGTEQKVFSVRNKTGNNVRFSAPICFEDAFAWVCRAQAARGSEFFVNITNDSWSQTESAEIQHLALSLYRAIENRRPLVRSTNSGVTCLVDRDGVVVQELPLFIRAALSVTVPVYPACKTFYQAAGLYFPLLLFIYALYCIVSMHLCKNSMHL